MMISLLKRDGEEKAKNRITQEFRLEGNSARHLFQTPPKERLVSKLLEQGSLFSSVLNVSKASSQQVRKFTRNLDHNTKDLIGLEETYKTGFSIVENGKSRTLDVHKKLDFQESQHSKKGQRQQNQRHMHRLNGLQYLKCQHTGRQLGCLLDSDKGLV